LPYKPETIDDIAKDMKEHGYREDRPVVLYQGKILDGRHRYEAALQAGVYPHFEDFIGTKVQAIEYVTSENVNRRHLNNREKEFFYVQRAEALGVQSRGGVRGNQYQSGNVENSTMAPPQKKHAEAIGVHRDTVAKWEKDRKEIKSDPELAAKATTPEGYQEAKKEVKKRRATKAEAEKIAKLKSLGERSEAESGNVDKKLDRYREQGIDVDAVQSQKEEESARDTYREKQKPIDELAQEIAQILIDQQDYKFVAALAKAAYPKDGELEHAYNIIKGT
jgi:hypothetical protein